MPSTSDIRSHSKALLHSVQQLDALLDRSAAAAGNVDELAEIAKRSEQISAALVATRARLQEAAEDSLVPALDPATNKRSLALAVAELPLEPALQALGEVPQLVEKVTAQSSSHAVLLVPLCLAYRHCLEALVPLAAGVDPRQLS